MYPYIPVDGRMHPRTVPLTLLRVTVRIRVWAYPYPYDTVRIRPYTVYGTVLTPTLEAGYLYTSSSCNLNLVF
jgi:hypothetical protein